MKKYNSYAVMLVLMLMSVSAGAVDFYIGGALGQSTAKIEGSSESATAGSVFGGVMFTKNLGVEASIIDFGKVSKSGNAGGVPFTASASSSGYTVAGVGALPLGERFTLSGRIGMAHTTTDGTVSAFGLSQSDSETATKPFYGISGGFKINSKLTVRASAERYTDVGGGDIGKTDIDVLSVGMILGF